MDHRSPLESIFNIIPHGHDKPVKHALYNAVALFILFLCLASGWALYLILEPFIKPLMWALLVGSVLHPLKHSLRERFRLWFAAMDDSHTPVFIGVMILPINIINDLSEFIGSNLLKHIKLILTVCIAIPAAHIFYYYTPRIITCFIWKFIVYTYNFINFIIDNASLTCLILFVIGYMSLMIFVWKPENNKNFHWLSIGVWLLVSCFIAHQFGSFQMAIFVVLQCIFAAGFASEVYDIHEEMKNAGQHITLFEAALWAFHDRSCLNQEHEKSEVIEQTETEILQPTSETLQAQSDDNVDETSEADTRSIKFSESETKTATKKEPWLELFEEKRQDSIASTDSDISNASLLITNKGKVHVIKQSNNPTISEILKTNTHKRDRRFKRSYSQPVVDTKTSFRYRAQYFKNSKEFDTISHRLIYPEQYASDFYIYTVLWACGVMLFWKNFMLLPFLPLPILIYVIKHVGIYLGVWKLLYFYWCKTINFCSQWINERYYVLVPVPVRGLYKIIHKINNNLKQSIKDSIDTVASCVVILGLIIFVTCASVFIAIQIYAEAIMLVQMTGNVINQTVVHNPELRQLLPPMWDDTVDSILDNAYQYGREGITKAVRGMMSDVDSAKSAKLEKQVLELWDRVYQTWMSSDQTHGPKVTHTAIQNSWDAFIDDIQKSPEMFNFSGIIEFVKQNIGTLMSLLESVWAILKGNMSLVLSSFSAFVSIVLGGGTAVLNFILNVIVFLTTLFYLLSSSGDLYKPVELLTNFSSSGTRFGLALEGAVNGVFAASFKMATFYGMWTWFIHNLFNVKIVYLPSAFATILGAVPFLGTYWAGIPAVLDLWLAQGNGLQAILFAAFQILPTSIVDTTIYKEIRGGGHPYLTGLAIAGGIFCLGVEGAIIGPLLLCGIYVAMDLSSSLFKDSPSDDSLNLRLELQDA